MRKYLALFIAAAFCLTMGACGNVAEEELSLLQQQISVLEENQHIVDAENTVLKEKNADLNARLKAAEEAISEYAAGLLFRPDFGLTDTGFDAGTVLVGDSLTHGFILNFLVPEGLLGDARYMAVAGMPLSQFFSDYLVNGSEDAKRYGNRYSPEFEGLNFADSLALVGDSVDTVYFMLGTNMGSETTWYKYVEVVDHILKCCPNATVFVLTVPYSSSVSINYTTPNESIHKAFEHYAAAGVDRVVLVDIFAVVGREHLVPDGVHLTYYGYEQWYLLLKAMAQEKT